jgi:uncharacterized surface protein with fasciclin (FAS1) repeats
MPSMLRRGFLALAPLAAGSLAMPATLRAQAPRTIADTLAGDTRFQRLLDLVVRASATESLRQAQPMTLFAPVDQAFVGAPAGLIQDLVGNTGSGQNIADAERQRINALLQYHMVNGALSQTELSGGERRIRTVNGGDILVSGTAPNITIRNPAPAQQLGSAGAAGAQMSASPAQLVGGPMMASNGVIYPISQILWP